MSEPVQRIVESFALVDWRGRGRSVSEGGMLSVVQRLQGKKEDNVYVVEGEFLSAIQRLLVGEDENV